MGKLFRVCYTTETQSIAGNIAGITSIAYQRLRQDPWPWN